MNPLDHLAATLDGDLLTPASPGYDTARTGAFARFDAVRPQAIVQCGSTEDVVRVVAYARATGTPIAARSGGHCFAGRSTGTGLIVDLARLDTVTVDAAGTARIGAGARLAHVYAALHQSGRTIPAGCGPGVGIAGLTLGGGIGLLGRSHGLTCDSATGARIVLADGRLIDCDSHHEPDLWWALRGAGGGQFGIVTRITFTTLPEPRATRFTLEWPAADAVAVATAWQDWAPDAPDDITANLTIVAAPGRPQHVTVYGAAARPADATGELLGELTALTGTPQSSTFDVCAWSELKGALSGPQEPGPSRTVIRSEFFETPIPAAALKALVAEQANGPTERRELNFTAMGGAYRRVPADATAFAHRHQRFLLDQVTADGDTWLDRSWAITHPHGSGGVYPNLPDPRLTDPHAAYHGANLARLRDVKRRYDPHRLFDFPQAI